MAASCSGANAGCGRGCAVVRVANTGITAGFDPYGRILGSIPLGESGALDLVVPEAIPRHLLLALEMPVFLFVDFDVCRCCMG